MPINLSILATMRDRDGVEHDLKRQLDQRQAGDFERLRYGGLVWGAAVLGIATLPVVMPLALAFSLVMPILCLATAARNQSRSGNSIETILTDIRRSPDLPARGTRNPSAEG